MNNQPHNENYQDQVTAKGGHLLNHQRPNVFMYLDHQLFLNAILVWLKGEKIKTKKQVAQEVGITDAYLSMISKGKREATEELIMELGKAMGLDRSETAYLLLLNKLNKEKDLSNQAKLIEQLRRFKDYRKLHSLEAISAKYLSRWFHVAIREYSYLPDFQLDARWIKNQMIFPVSTQEIENAIDFLLENKFIELHPNGKVTVKERVIELREEALKPALAEFHKQMLFIAVKSIAAVPSEERRIVGHTQLIGEKTAQRAMQIMHEAEQEIMKLIKSSDETGDRVYHFSFLAIPLTHSADKEEETRV